MKAHYATLPKTKQLALPEGLLDGVNYHEDNTSATLVLTAPKKSHVFVIGDFNDWRLDEQYLMYQSGDQFWLPIENLEPKKEYKYQYFIDGEIVLADPYTHKVSSSFDERHTHLQPFPADLTEFAASYLQTDRPTYDWKVKNFIKPAKENLVIYELLVRDFAELRSYQAVEKRLDYLKSLGVNAIELLPVTTFEGHLSWGYNPCFMLASEKSYGTAEQLKSLIDEAHQRGIAVIFDIVLNHHFGKSPLVRMFSSGKFGPPTSENIWFNTSPKHDFNVGYDFNHESKYTKNYVDRVVTYWTEEFQVDGYRFDLSKGFTQKNTLGNVAKWGQYDATRVSLLKRMADVIWKQDPTTYVILEHFADSAEEKELANYGMMLWANMNRDFRKAARGESVRLSSLYFKEKGWDKPHAVHYMESHDEERVMWDISQNAKTNLEYRLNRLKMNAVFFFLVPGPKMLWQFGEMGYDEELNNDRLGVKPTHWEYLKCPKRKRLFSAYQSLINLKTNTNYINESTFSWNGNSSFKWLNYNNTDVKIVAFANFSNSTQAGDPHFIEAGDWYNYFTGERLVVRAPNREVSLKAGEFYVYTSQKIDNFINDPSPVGFGYRLRRFISNLLQKRKRQ